MASNTSEKDDVGGTVDPAYAVSAALIPGSSAAVAAAEPGKSPPEALTTLVEEEGSAEKDAAQTVTGVGSGSGGLGAAVDVDVEAAVEVGTHEKVKDDVDMTDVGESKVVMEVGAEDAENELADEKMMDKGHIFTAELGVEADTDAGGVGNQDVQVPEQQPSERRKRGRPRRSITVEDSQRARYLHPFQYEKNGGFAVSDLVWGKVRSHPWWPGQIFDAANASDMALNAQKEGHFLVVYFGDKTFAWCDESHLKPFQTYFSQLEKQSSADVFGAAVNDALAEVYRLIELGMTCSCLNDEVYVILKGRKVENAGVREGTCSSSVNKFWNMNSFEPPKMVDYVRMLALCPCSGADSLDLVIAKAHLKAFRHWNGFPELPVFVLGQGLENDGESSPTMERNHGNNVVDLSAPVSSDYSPQKEKLISRLGTSRKKKHVLEEGRKKRSLSELMGEKIFPHNIDGYRSGSGARDFFSSSGRRQKVASACPSVSGKGKMKKLDSLGDLTTQSPNHSKQLIVQECIGQFAGRRSQSLTMIKKNPHSLNHRRRAVPDDPNMHLGTGSVKGGASKDYSPHEMLSQMCLAARDPLKTYSFLGTTISFFTEFSDWVLSSSSEDKRLTEIVGSKRSRRKLSNFKTTSSDLTAPDYIQDSYWSDIIVCSNFEEELGSEGQKRNGESPAKRQKKTRKKLKEEPELFLPSGPMPEAEQYLQIGSASTGIAHELEAESPLDNLEDVYDCISINCI